MVCSVESVCGNHIKTILVKVTLNSSVVTLRLIYIMLKLHWYFDILHFKCWLIATRDARQKSASLNSKYDHVKYLLWGFHFLLCDSLFIFTEWTSIGWKCSTRFWGRGSFWSGIYQGNSQWLKNFPIGYSTFKSGIFGLLIFIWHYPNSSMFTGQLAFSCYYILSLTISG